MQNPYRTIKENSCTEIEIKKSRFICQLHRVKTEDDAKAFIQQVKKEHWKANHNCSAFTIGDRNEIQRTSDDGEPSGTAGVPMLEVLKKQKLINVAAVVTRYFGGTKLGSGGLIRAYSKSVSEAIKASGIVTGIPQRELIVTIQYPMLAKLQKFLEEAQITIESIDYTEKVSLTLLTDEAGIQKTEEALVDLLSGQVDCTRGKKKIVEKPLLLP